MSFFQIEDELLCKYFPNISVSDQQIVYQIADNIERDILKLFCKLFNSESKNNKSFSDFSNRKNHLRSGSGHSNKINRNGFGENNSISEIHDDDFSHKKKEREISMCNADTHLSFNDLNLSLIPNNLEILNSNEQKTNLNLVFEIIKNCNKYKIPKTVLKFLQEQTYTVDYSTLISYFLIQSSAEFMISVFKYSLHRISFSINLYSRKTKNPNQNLDDLFNISSICVDSKNNEQITVANHNPNKLFDLLIDVFSCLNLPRLITPSYLNNLVFFEGTACRISPSKPFLTHFYYVCTFCKIEKSVLNIDDTFHHLCKCKRSFVRINTENARLKDSQSVKIKGAGDEYFDVVFYDKFINMLNPGDFVQGVGIVKLLKEKSGFFTAYLEVNNCFMGNCNKSIKKFEETISTEPTTSHDTLNKSFSLDSDISIFDESVKISKDRSKRKGNIESNKEKSISNPIFYSFNDDFLRFKEVSLIPNLINLLQESLFPTIYGYSAIKLACLLSTVLPNKTNNVDGLSVLLIGDPGLGKSQILLKTSKITKSIYVTGNNTTNAGLTMSLTNEGCIEGGAVVLANDGCLFIDEFDKVLDCRVVHDILDGEVVFAKGGVYYKNKVCVSLICATNPKNGHYMNNKNIYENVRFDKNILDRFDLVFVMTEKYDKEMVRKIIDHKKKDSKSQDDGINSACDATEINDKKILIKIIDHKKMDSKSQDDGINSACDATEINDKKILIKIIDHKKMETKSQDIRINSVFDSNPTILRNSRIQNKNLEVDKNKTKKYDFVKNDQQLVENEPLFEIYQPFNNYKKDNTNFEKNKIIENCECKIENKSGNIEEKNKKLNCKDVKIDENRKISYAESIPYDLAHKYINFCKENLNPVISKSGKILLKKYFVEKRIKENYSIRILKTLIKITKSMAKLQFKNIADDDDIKKAIEIFEYCSIMKTKNDFSENRSSEKISKKKENITTYAKNKEKLLDYIENNNGKIMEKREIMELIEKCQETKSTEKYFNKLHNDGYFIKIKGETYKLTKL